MIFFYDILFSVKVCVHDGENIRDELHNNFQIVPSGQCRRLLRQFNLLFKPVSGGALILQEKVGTEENNAVAKRPIVQLTTFTFIIELKDKTLLGLLAPYVEEDNGQIVPVKLDPIPSFGKKQILYFDNLDDSNSIIVSLINSDCQKKIRFDANGDPVRDADGNFQYEAVQVAPLTQLAGQLDYGVTADDLGATMPNRFVPADLSGLEVRPIRPGSSGALAPNPPDDTSERAYFQLADGAYTISQNNGAGTTENVVYANNELVNTGGIGIVRIIKENQDPSFYEIKFNLV